MASRYWVGSTTSWNTSSNWASTSGGSGGAGVPGASDDVIFDGNGTGNCTADVAINIASVDVQSGYSGTIDLADSSYSHAISGNATFAGGGEIDQGNSTLTISGDFNYLNQTSWTPGVSGSIVMDGASKTITGTSALQIYKLKFSGNTTVSSNTNQYIKARGSLTVDAGITVTMTEKGLSCFIGTFTNNGTISMVSPSAFNGKVVVDYATVSAVGTITHYDNSKADAFHVANTSTINTNTFGVPTKFDCFGKTITINGDLTFNYDLTINKSSSSDAVDNSGNYDLTYKGDLITSGTGTLTYTKGTGAITISGTVNQDLDFDGQNVEDITINKSSGTATLTGDVDTDSFTGTSGTLDLGGFTLDSTGNVTIAAGFDVEASA